MSRKPQIPVCSEDDRRTLADWANSRSIEWRLVERAKMITKILDGMPIREIAQTLGTGQNTVIKWRNRFAVQGIKGLYDSPRSGKPVKYDKDFRNSILRTLELPPPKGQTCWNGPAIARHLRHRMMPFGECSAKRASASPDNEAGVSVQIRSSHPKRLISSACTWPRHKMPW